MLSQADKEYTLIQNGFDPARYDMDDSGQVTAKNISPPVVDGFSQMMHDNMGVEKPIQPDDSNPMQQPATAMQVGMHSAARSILPTLGGLGAGALALSLAPETGGLSLLGLLGVGAGVGAAGAAGSYGVDKMQDLVLPDELKDQLAKEQQEHPIASAVGGIAPSLPFFNPVKGIRNLIGIGMPEGESGIVGTIGKLLGTNPNSATLPEKARLINMAANLGVQGGMDVGQQEASGQPFNWGQLGFSLGTGALLSEPTALGEKIFSHGEPTATDSGGTEPITKQNQPTAPQQSDLGTPSPVTGNPPVDLSALGVPSNPNESALVSKKSDALTGYKGDVNATEAELNNMEVEGGKSNTSDTGVGELEGMPPADKKQQDYQRALIEQENQKKEELRQQAAQALMGISGQDLSNVNPITEGTNPQRDNTRGMQKANEEVASGNDLEERKQEGLGDKYQGAEEENNDLLKNASPEYFNKVADLARKRGISLQQAAEIVGPAGDAKRGSYNPATRTATVSSSIATKDTPVHEIQHGFMDDLKASNKPADSLLRQRALSIFGGSEAKADEFVTQHIGKDAAQTLEGKDAKSRWFRDFISRWKNTLGVASDKDVLNYLSRRLVSDAPRGSRGELSAMPQLGGSAGRLSELQKKQDLNPEEAAERDALQKKSDSVKWKFQDEKLPEGTHKAEDGTIVPNEINFGNAVGNPTRNNVEGREPMLTFNDLTGKEAARNKIYDAFYGKLFEKTKNPTGAEMTATANEAKDFIKRMKLDENGNASDNNVKYQGALPEDRQLGGKVEGEETTSKLPYKTAGPFTAEADVIRRKDGLRSEPAIAAMGKTIDDAKMLTNKYKGMYAKATEGLTEAEKNRVEQAGHLENEDGVSYRDKLSAKEQKAFDGVKEMLRTIATDRQAANMPVSDFDAQGKATKREAQIDPHFWPNQANPAKMDILQHNKPGASALRESLLSHFTENGATPEQAKARLDSMMQSFEPNTPNLAHFRGLDIAQGSGLPFDMMRSGMDRNMDRYIRRVSSARAFYDNIESNKDVAPLFGIKQDPWGRTYEGADKVEPLQSREAHDVYGRLKGQDYHPDEAKIKPFIRTANALALGPLTNAHILVSSVANAQSYFRPHELVNANIHALRRFNKSISDAVSTGSLEVGKRKMFSDLLDANATQGEKMASLADGISRLNGRGATDYVTKGLTQGLGDYLVRARIPMAKAGNKDAIRIMKQLDPSWTPDKQYSEGDIAKAASAFSGLLHGNHDFRTLPGWMLRDTIVQPFTSLMSWNVAQTNAFMKHVWTPATEGNYTPLIMSTLGAALGGYILKEGREKLANKKSPIPSLEELVKSPYNKNTIPLAAYNLMAMASYSGYAGVMSTGARTLFDLAYKNPTQGGMFPLDSIIGESGKTMSQTIAALMNSNASEYGNIGMHAIADLFRENVQSARMAVSWADEYGLLGKQRQEKKVLNNEEGDLRRFKMIKGIPYEDESSIDESNPYFNMGRKNFKNESDIGTAAKELPGLIQQALSESGGNIEVFKSKLAALKSSSYPSMPSPERTPRQFYQYIQYLNQTQGPEVAAQRVAEYMKKNAINKAKSSMIPSL